MKEEKTTPLRERMIEDMRIRGMGEKTQRGYVRAIKDFAAFLGRQGKINSACHAVVPASDLIGIAEQLAALAQDIKVRIPSQAAPSFRNHSAPNSEN